MFRGGTPLALDFTHIYFILCLFLFYIVRHKQDRYIIPYNTDIDRYYTIIAKNILYHILQYYYLFFLFFKKREKRKYKKKKKRLFSVFRVMHNSKHFTKINKKKLCITFCVFFTTQKREQKANTLTGVTIPKIFQIPKKRKNKQKKC